MQKLDLANFKKVFFLDKYYLFVICKPFDVVKRNVGKSVEPSCINQQVKLFFPKNCFESIFG